MSASASTRRAGFTLVELLVSMAVLALILVLVSQMLNATRTITLMGSKQMDADAGARALFDRMAIDIASAVKRADVDYYLKGRPAGNVQTGNDQIAFYSEVPGYYPSPSSQSPVSLVAYRLPPDRFRIERLGKGLLWNGASTTEAPVVFLPVPLASPLPSPLPSPQPSPAPATMPSPAWPQAANMDADVDYETIGPQVFRFEYYYVLKGQDVTTNPSVLSDAPWDARAPLGHTDVHGLRDVAAIGVVIAVIDSKTRVLVSEAQLKALAEQMEDFHATGAAKELLPGYLEAKWQDAVTASALPIIASSALRIYGRTFSLDTAR